jgi:predicted transcriptional regulator
MATPIKPTVAELEILDILWDKRKATVGEIHKMLDDRRPTAYTTVLKFMQIMLEKGLLKRDESERAHTYQPAVSRKRTQATLVSDLLERAFRGSALKLVQHVLETKPATREELEEIRRLIAETEAKASKK